MPDAERPGFASFVDVARLLNSSLDLETVLRRLLEGVDRLLGPSHWSLLLRDRRSGELVFSLVKSTDDQALLGRRLRPDEGIAGWVASRGESLLIPDVSKDERFSPRMDDATGFATRSIVAVPLRTGSEVLGVMEVINALDEREFTGEDVGILEAFADFAAVAIQNARAHGELLETSRNDPLTGLRNSSFFLRSVEEAVARGERLALVFFDMDRFKPLVDRHGHIRGSAALQEVGRLLAEGLRDGEIGCRFGGDEFALLLRGADGARAAERARALAERIERHVFLEAEGICARLGASFGWAAHPADAATAGELLNLADARMYGAKRARHCAR
jgi:diguanylate cyclase (GGDEF)-like protein